MNAHITYGTIEYLLKLIQKHSSKLFYLMTRQNETVVYYEDNQTSIFAESKDYNILISDGNMNENGFVVMNNIPVTDEGKPLFETNFRQHKTTIKNIPGFQALRLLKPLSDDTYVVLTQWESEQSYQIWRNSTAFAKAHELFSAKHSIYFLEEPLTLMYSMYNPDEED